MNTSVIKLLPGVLIFILLTGCGNEEKGRDHQPQQADSLVITDAWARPAAKGSNSAAYMTIHNHTSHTDTLIGVFSNVVKLAEIHKSVEERGVAGMFPAGKLAIKSGDRLDLKPGGLHVMLTHLKKQLVTGDSLQLNLEFTEAGVREVAFVVR